MRSYLDRRRRFLVEVVRADLHDFDDEPGAAIRIPTDRQAITPEGPETRTTVAASDCGDPAGADLEAMLLDLAAERTGFPRESLTAHVRLLDDLNLDSIKAAELVAGAAKSARVAGRIDPAGLANASLAEIAATIRQALGDDPSPAERSAVRPSPSPAHPAEPASDSGPSWVRNFVIEYVPDAA
jgi:hypothetical protein